jgi:DNA-binding beta-propeller fold protein YncE
MKRNMLFVLLAAALTIAPATTATAQTSANPNQVAILRWYAANLTASFSAGSAPRGIAYDGGNIWITLQGSNQVAKIRPSDGVVLATYPVGNSPIGIVSPAL